MAINKHTLSERGLNMIRSFEGLKLTAYEDIAGKWTIGYGCTYYANGKGIQPADRLPNKECAADLLSAVLKDFERTVNRVVSAPINQNQYDALVCFHYNTGSLPSSNLLKKLNSEDYTAAAAQFLVWNKVTDPGTGKKKISDVLVRRREKEMKLFNTPV
ncbi:lysozyme [Mucilaginibacter sp. cycad4]|uniref:lysozyme n=1 Tax=Mucilaginibacter sp. cycad4 TaxID=3342096 RepID=UPI002AABCFDF|nr:lysozyme [Mucilaginibacter gossypii]WPU98388.1 lysozyme [Mucilaginibacter gossypii]